MNNIHAGNTVKDDQIWDVCGKWVNLDFETFNLGRRVKKLFSGGDLSNSSVGKAIPAQNKSTSVFDEQIFTFNKSDMFGSGLFYNALVNNCKHKLNLGKF